MKVLILIVGDQHTASTQYRFGQFAAFMREFGCDMTLLGASKFNDWSLVEAQDLIESMARN